MTILDTNHPLTITATVAFIQQAHDGQFYGDMPYFLHPVEVAQQVQDLAQEFFPNADQQFVNSCVLAALLHDVVEDTEYVLEDLQQRYCDSVVQAVDLLTKKQDGLNYAEYVQTIIDSGNLVAMLVKLADNYVNLYGDKSDFSVEKAQRLNDRYKISIVMLENALTAYHN